MAGAFAVAGCGGSTSGGTASPVPQDQFADRAVAALCDNIAACCKAGGYPYDCAGCAAMVAPLFSSVSQDPSVVYDPNAAGACIHALAASASSCTDQTSDGAACDSVFRGTKPVGSACQNDAECAAPSGGKAYCAMDNAGNQVCVAQARGKAGDSCQETCTSSTGGSTCSGGVATGGGGSGGAGAGGAGGGSFGDATCYTNDGLYCSATYVCTPLGQVGASCDYGGCVGSAYCDGSTCVARVAVGQPCPSYDSCVEAAYCNDSGVCANKKANGAACQTGDECSGGRCQGTCSSGGSIASPELCGATPPPQPGGGGGGASSGGGGVSSGSGGAPSPTP